MITKNVFCMKVRKVFCITLENRKDIIIIAWRKCVRRILASPYNTHCNLLSNIAQDTSIDSKLQKRFCNFIQNAYVSNNKCIKVFVNLVAQPSKSNVSRTWNFISSIYN